MHKDKGIVYDKVFMFSDGQLRDSNPGRYGGLNGGRGNKDVSHINKRWIQYKKINPAAQLYIFDLAGYGTSPVDLRENDTYMIAGWSDKIFDIIKMIDEGKSALDKIKSIKV
jgi:hypothetical protein